MIWPIDLRDYPNVRREWLVRGPNGEYLFFLVASGVELAQAQETLAFVPDWDTFTIELI